MEGINIRISDQMREGLRLLAKKERRRMSDLARIIIEDYLASHSIEIKELSVEEQLAEQEEKKVSQSGRRAELGGGRSMLTGSDGPGPTESELLARIAKLEELARGKS